MNAGTELITAGGRPIRVFGGDAALTVIQPTGAHEEEALAGEFRQITEAGADVTLVCVPVTDWNRDLSPWEAPPVFGNRPFGSGAADTLRAITDDCLPALEAAFPLPGARRYLLCGYSLAGLFALWASYTSDRFAGAAGVSPSVWFPGWSDYAASHDEHCRAVYLSLGDREERAKNPRLAAVGDCIRAQYARLCAAGVRCTLEMNPGNHFVDFERRMAKAVVWLAQNAKADSDQ